MEKTWQYGKNIIASCVCICGKRWIGRFAHLQKGNIKSCGCKIAFQKK